MSDTTLNQFVASGTNAERLAYTPSPPTVAAGPDSGYFFYETDTGDTYSWDGSAWQIVGSGGGSGTVTNTGTLTSGKLIQGNGTTDVTVNATTATIVKLASGVPSAATAGTDYVSPTYLPMVCTARLTTESGVPVSTSDRTAQGTIYFTPCTPGGTATTTGAITLYSGSALVMFTFTELSLALTATSGKNYDVFVDYNAGTPQLVLSAAWTNDTTRADALGVQSGLIVKSGTATYRWIGTIRASGANTTEDSAAKRFIWNAYNQVRRLMQGATETTDSWTYTTATYRQANANAANQLAYVSGDPAYIDARVQCLSANSTVGGSRTTNVGIGVDSTSVNSCFTRGTQSGPVANAFTSCYADYRGTIALGYHFLPWLEFSEASGTTTWYGDAGDTTRFQSGIIGTIAN